MEGPSKWPFLPADMHGTRQISPHVQELNTAKGSTHRHWRQIRPNAFTVARVLLINIVIWQPIFPSVERSDADWSGVSGISVCAFTCGPTSPLLPIQADHFHVKWAVINCVISLHQLYPEKSPKSNTKKKGLALETSVKVILDHRSN